jgi:hypothetical protein
MKVANGKIDRRSGLGVSLVDASRGLVCRQLEDLSMLLASVCMLLASRLYFRQVLLPFVLPSTLGVGRGRSCLF